MIVIYHQVFRYLKMKRIWCFIKRIIGSHTFEMILFGLFYGMTAISPDILKDPMVFGNYIGFIILNVFIQESEKQHADREYQNKIDSLQQQIDKLKK